MAFAETEIEVRYAETDQMGVVYHSNYLVWMEIARNRFIDSLGLHYYDMEKAGFLSPVVDVNIHYAKPFRYGQTAVVKTWISAYDGIRVTYSYEIRYHDRREIAITGSTTHVCVAKETFRPFAMRRIFKEWDKRYRAALVKDEQ